MTRLSAYTICHSFATHLLQSGTDIHTVQELLKHREMSTTRIYIDVLKVTAEGSANLLDSLALHWRSV